MPGNYNQKDHYYKLAKNEGLSSRAAFKLIEIEKLFKIFKQGQTVLDLGSYPGGWTEVSLNNVGKKGRVISVDKREVLTSDLKLDSNSGTLEFLKLDIFEEESIELLKSKLELDKVDIVLSDLSPSLSGIQFRDSYESSELVISAFEIAKIVLKDGGSFVAKIFPGPEADQLFLRLRKNFSEFKRKVLKSTRQTSKEFYFIGKSFQRGNSHL